MPFVPEFSAALSAPLEFPCGVPEKDFCKGRPPTFDLKIINQILYQPATSSLCRADAVAPIHLLAGIFQPYL
jgi:hypothetical protein